MSKIIFNQVLIFFVIFLCSSMALAQSDSPDILSSIDYSGFDRIYNNMSIRSSVSEESYGSILTDILNYYGVDGKDFCHKNSDNYYDESSPVFTYKITRGFIACLSKMYSLGDSIYAFYLLNGKMSYVNKPKTDLQPFIHSFPWDSLKKLDPNFLEELNDIYKHMSDNSSYNILDLMAQWVSFLYEDLETLDLLAKGKISSSSISQDVGKRAVSYMILTLSSLKTIEDTDPSFYSSMSNRTRVSAIFKHFFKLMYQTIFNPYYNPMSEDLETYFKSFIKNPDFQDITTNIHKYLGIFWTRDNLTR